MKTKSANSQCLIPLSVPPLAYQEDLTQCVQVISCGDRPFDHCADLQTHLREGELRPLGILELGVAWISQ